jgi:hypothetical protein
MFTTSTEAFMTTGQLVQLKVHSRNAQRASIPAHATGTVICSYRLLQPKPRHPERVDVDFKDYGVLWGEPSIVFEALEPTETSPGKS